MRLWIAAGVVVSLLSLSALSGESRDATPPRFLESLQVGERILLRAHGGQTGFSSDNYAGVHVTVVTDEELKSLLPTAEERKEFDALQQEERTLAAILEKRRNAPRESTRDPEERQKFFEDQRRLNEWRETDQPRWAKLKEKMNVRPYTVTAIGPDYLAYRGEDRRVTYLPAGRILSITRPPAEAPETDN